MPVSRLSVIIPAYNEARRLPLYLERVLAFLDAQSGTYEVIVVDDGSSDGTPHVVEQFCLRSAGIRLIRLPENRGKGHAVKTGMMAAKGAMRLFADADGATPIGEVARLINAVERGADIAVGSRALTAGDCTVKGKWYRKVIGTVFNRIVRAMAVRSISDTQCGFKLFTGDAAERIFPLQTIDGFGFDAEILFIAQRFGYRLAEVPVNWTDIKGTKVKLVRDSIRMFFDVLKIRINDWRGAYGRYR
jgi:dolichyl-phosphate beta-glucosyltransferase